MQKVLLVALIVAAATRGRAQPAQYRERAPPSAAKLLVLSRSDSLVWSIDWVGARTLSVWFTVVDCTPARVNQVAAPFRRFETLQELDCFGNRVRNLRIRTPDLGGRIRVWRARLDVARFPPERGSAHGASLHVPTLGAACSRGEMRRACGRTAVFAAGRLG